MSRVEGRCARLSSGAESDQLRANVRQVFRHEDTEEAPPELTGEHADQCSSESTAFNYKHTLAFFSRSRFAAEPLRQQ